MGIAGKIRGFTATALLIVALMGCGDTESPIATADQGPVVGVLTLTITPNFCKTTLFSDPQRDTLSDDLETLCADTIRCRAFFDSITGEGTGEVPVIDDLIVRGRWIKTGPTRWEFDDAGVAAVLGPILQDLALAVSVHYPEQGGSYGRQNWSIGAIADSAQTLTFQVFRQSLDEPPEDGGYPSIGNSVEYDGDFQYVNLLQADWVDVMTGWASIRVENLRSVPAD